MPSDALANIVAQVRDAKSEVAAEEAQSSFKSIGWLCLDRIELEAVERALELAAAVERLEAWRDARYDRQIVVESRVRQTWRAFLLESNQLFVDFTGDEDSMPAAINAALDAAERK